LERDADLKNEGKLIKPNDTKPNMKKLTTTGIHHHGHSLDIIERTETLGLFFASFPNATSPGFIVAKITQNQECTRTMPDGKVITYAAAESLPPESQYGKQAWFFRSISDARNKFEALSKATKIASNA